MHDIYKIIVTSTSTDQLVPVLTSKSGLALDIISMVNLVIFKLNTFIKLNVLYLAFVLVSFFSMRWNMVAMKAQCPLGCTHKRPCSS
jgi:uncharacterized membrane protein